MKKLIIGILIVLMSSLPCLAANTIVISEGAHTVSITDIDSDWTLSDSFAWATTRTRIHSIQFNPGAIDDHCRILDTDATGAAIFDVTAESIYDERIKYFPDNKEFMPFLDYSAGTYSAGAEIIIILK